MLSAEQLKAMKPGELLTELAKARIQIKKNDSKMKPIKDLRDEIESRLMRHCEDEEIETLANDKITFKLVVKQIARYDPEHWEDIFKWAAESGNLDIIQRRLGDSKVAELAKTDTKFPKGLSIESINRPSVRLK